MERIDIAICLTKRNKRISKKTPQDKKSLNIIMNKIAFNCDLIVCATCLAVHY